MINNNEESDYQKAVQAVKDSMISVFERTRIFPDGRIYEIRAVIGRYNNLKFEIFPNEHPPPHFHVFVNGQNASFSISDCELLNGQLKSNDEKKVRYWYKMHQEQLIKSWNRFRPDNCSVGPIV